MRRAVYLLCVAVLGAPALLMARSKQIEAIDRDCDGLHELFREATPLRFSGPSPLDGIGGRARSRSRIRSRLGVCCRTANSLGSDAVGGRW